MKRFLFFGLSLLFVSHAFSQTHVGEAWIEGSVLAEISSKIDLDIVAEAKFQQNGMPLKSVAGEIGINYKIIKPLSIGVSYKCSEKNKFQGFFPTHTTSLIIGYKQKFGDFKFSYRNKFELSREMYINERVDLSPVYEDRNRIKIQYEIKKIKTLPYISVESFHPISYSSGYSVSEVRYSVGLDFDLKKKFEFGVGYLYKIAYSNSGNEYISVLNVSLSKSL